MIQLNIKSLFIFLQVLFIRVQVVFRFKYTIVIKTTILIY
jgi:hypothetical protein